MADLFDLAVYAHWLLRLLLYGGGTGEGESSSSPPQALLPRSLSFCFFSVRFRLWVVFPWDPVRIFKQIAFIHLSLYQHSAQKRCINTSFTVLCQICVDAKVQNSSVPVWGDLITETHAHTCTQLEGSLFQERFFYLCSDKQSELTVYQNAYCLVCICVAPVLASSVLSCLRSNKTF